MRLEMKKKKRHLGMRYATKSFTPIHFNNKEIDLILYSFLIY